MLSRSVRRIFSAAMVVMALSPMAVAENPSDDVSGYNPFDGTGVDVTPQPTTSGTNVSEMFGANQGSVSSPFDNSNASADIFNSQAATGTFSNATGTAGTDPFAMGASSGTAVSTDPFAMSNSSAATDAGNAASAANPFAMGTGNAATAADPFAAGTNNAATAADPFATGTNNATTATDPFATGTNNATAAADPFATGTNNATAAADPFATGTNNATAAADPFATGTNSATAAADPFATGTNSAATAADPFATGTNNAATAADPFATGTNSAATAADPFGTGTSAAGANAYSAAPTTNTAPMPTVSGYNPFTDAQNETIQAVPANTVMYVGASTLRLRIKPAENTRVNGTFYFGQELTVLATQGDWAQVQNPNNNSTGYCMLNELTYANPNTLSKTMYAQLGTTPIYRAPTLKSGRVRNLKQGDTTTQVAITADGLWSRVTDGTTYGFVPTVYLDDTPSSEGTQVWCLSGATPVMVNPENWTQISTLSFGQQAWLVGYVNNNAIAKIRSAKDYVAYCDASALTTVDPANMNTPVYVQAGGKVLFNAATEDARHSNINKNAYLTLLGVDNSQYWALVRQGKRKLYIPFIYLGTERLNGGNKVVVVNQDAPLYSSAEAGATVVATLPLGTRLYLGGGDGIYAQVATIPDGATQAATGFVPMQYLRNGQ